MAEVIRKYLELRDAIKGGDWLLAAQIAYEVLGLFLAREGHQAQPVADTADDVDDAQKEELKTAIKEVKKAGQTLPKGLKAAKGGPFAALILPALIPIVTKLIEAWLKKNKLKENK
jgi:hypothetical protein